MGERRAPRDQKNHYPRKSRWRGKRTEVQDGVKVRFPTGTRARRKKIKSGTRPKDQRLPYYDMLRQPMFSKNSIFEFAK